jgi:transposase
MQIKTILNRIEDHKGFVFGKERFGAAVNGEDCIEFPVRSRKRSKAICSRCGVHGSTYDHLPERRFRYVPLWGYAVMLVYALRRVDCADCGVTVEYVPWATGKSPITRSLALFLADWAKLLSWQDVAQRFCVNWHQVFESVSYVVTWGLVHRDLSGVTALGVDEIQFGKGQQYLTVVYQLCGNVRRLLFVGKDREAASLSVFFEEMGADWCGHITHVCSDMWRAYLNAIKKHLLGAVHILDRFHIVKLLNEAVDKVRRQEAAQFRKEGIDLLKGLKYVFLKRPENLTDHQQELLQGIINNSRLRSVRAYLWKEKFQLFWQYNSPYWAQWYLKRWCKGAMRSRLEPLKKFVATIRKHEPLIMNWFKAKKQFSSGAVEGMNRKVNLITRKAYGYRNYEVLKIALFHALGHLPEPERTHRF